MLTLALLSENKWVWTEKVQIGARKHVFPWHLYLNARFRRLYRDIRTQLVPVPRVRSRSRLTIAGAGWCLSESDSQASPPYSRGCLGERGANMDKEPGRENTGPTVNWVGRVLTALKRGLICSEGSSISPAGSLLHTASFFFFFFGTGWCAEETGLVDTWTAGDCDCAFRERLTKDTPPKWLTVIDCQFDFNAWQSQPIIFKNEMIRVGSIHLSPQSLKRAFFFCYDASKTSLKEHHVVLGKTLHWLIYFMPKVTK